MIPCILLTTFLVVLVRILGEVRARRERLLGNGHGEGCGGRRKGEAGDRTTRMLITVICVFLSTELPQGLLLVASGLFSQEFKHHVYNNLGDVLDLVPSSSSSTSSPVSPCPLQAALVNSCATFVIYCSMSKQYRSEFARIFLPRRLLLATLPCLR